MHTLKRPHYAWFVCLGGALAFYVGMGLAANLFALCLPDLKETLNLDNAQASWLSTIRSLFTLFTMLWVNQLCARFGLRQTLTVGAALIGLAYFGLSRAISFPAGAISCAVLGTGYCLCGPVPVSLALGRWFESRRSLALGLASAGSGIATIVLPPILTKIKSQFGLSTAFLTLSVSAFALGTIIWLLIRNSPQEHSLAPYRQNSLAQKSAPVRSAPPPMSAFQNGAILLASLLMAPAAGPGFSHVQSFFRSEGYDAVLVSTLTSCMGVVLLVGKIVCGQIFDRLGGRLGNYYIFGMLLTGQTLFFLAPLGSVPLAFLAITVFALGIPISSVANARWAADLYGEQNYASAVRSITVAYTVGTLIFGPIPGILADAFNGSYLPSYLLFIILLAVSLILLRTIYCQLGAGRWR